MTEKVLYSELTPKEFRERIAQTPIAYLPLGTLEWHGEHLPLGADGLQSQGFFVELAKKCGGIVLPTLFLGTDRKEVVDEKDYYGMDVFGFKNSSPRQLDGSAYWIEDSLFRNLIEAILRLLRRAGFRIVVAHGHGPSTSAFRGWSKELSEKSGMKLLTVWREGSVRFVAVRDGCSASAVRLCSCAPLSMGIGIWKEELGNEVQQDRCYHRRHFRDCWRSPWELDTHDGSSSLCDISCDLDFRIYRFCYLKEESTDRRNRTET